MISNKMRTMILNNSTIREMFEEGKRLASIYGEENVFDFSIGNPNVEPPEEIKSIIKRIVNEEKPNLLHGYMNNSGYEDVREAIANHLSKEYKLKLKYENTSPHVITLLRINIKAVRIVEDILDVSMVGTGDNFLHRNNLVIGGAAA